MLVAFSVCCASWGRWSALLFAGRAGSALTVKIGLDAGDGAALQYGDDGGRSIAPGDFAALLGGVISLPPRIHYLVAAGIQSGSLVGA